MSVTATNNMLQMVAWTTGCAAIGALAAYIFTAINPIHGAVFGGAYYLILQLVDLVVQKIFENDEFPIISHLATFTITTAVCASTGLALNSTLYFLANLSGGILIAIPIAIFKVYCTHLLIKRFCPEEHRR